MLTATLENVLNRGLPRSPRAQQLCAELIGRKIAIEIPDVTRLTVESTGDSLRIGRDGSAVETEVVGGPFSLLALGGDSPEAVIRRGDVQIRGDTELAEKYRELARLLRPDLEEELAGLIGDVPAHQGGRLVRAMLGWSRNAATAFQQNVAEYLGHERQHLVPRNEGEQFLRGVDALREDLDRLEARIDLLNRLGPK